MLVPVGLGTEEMEAIVLVDVLRRAGADVLLASVEEGLEIKASSGTRFVADTSIAACAHEVFDLVALPGGMPGSARLRDCKILQNIMEKQAEEKRLYGAICAAPAVVLHAWGLTKRKQITCHPAFMHKLPSFRTVKSNVEVSGDLTTSRGPGTALEFSLSFVRQLFGDSLAEEIQGTLLVTSDGFHRKEEFNETEWSFNHTPRVLIPVANGSEEMEVVTIVDILKRAKIDVIIASVEKSVQIVASQGTKLIADLLIGAAKESLFDLIILPGGVSGSEQLQKSRILKKLLKEQKASGRVIGATCSSPVVLQKFDLLTTERITAHPSVIQKLVCPIADGVGVVIDGKLITSRGLSTASDFSLAIVNKLFGPVRARCVADGLVFAYPRS